MNMSVFPSHLRPEKIRWIFPETGENWMTSIPSKSTRKLLANVSTLQQQNNFEFTWKVMSESDYTQWLPFYTEKMLEQNHDIIATESWYLEKKAEGKEIYLLECKDKDTKRLLGAGVILDTQNEWAFAFKATERINTGSQDNSSLGLLFELEYLRYCMQLQPRTVTSGSSRNAFGFYNTVGYLLAKLRIGYLPTIFKDNLVTTFPMNEDTPTIWFTRNIETQKDGFLLSHPQERYSQEFFHFCQTQNIVVHESAL